MNKIYVILACVIIFPFAATNAQLTIEMCQEKARTNYPLIRRTALIEQSTAYNLDNLAKGFLPQVSVTAKVTYQSEVTKVPINLPNVQIEGLTRDQYLVSAEVTQTLWDGGVIRSQQKIMQSNAEFEKQKLETDLYTLRERVNQLFFGILLLDEQLKQNDILREELQTNHGRITSCIENGVANQSDLDAIKVEQLNSGQRRTEMNAAKKAYREMLSAMTGERISEQTGLLKPEAAIPLDPDPKNRPELRMFEAQTSLLENQGDLINARNTPKIGLFLQGGIGKPGLNMLKNEFSPFYLGGIRLNWNFGGLYTRKNDYHLIELNKNGVGIQKETFLYNTGLMITQQNNESDKLRQLISTDDTIIQLRSNIKKSAEAKVENGMITTSDLVREINAENMARQNKLLHEIQLLMSVYNLKTITNN